MSHNLKNNRWKENITMNDVFRAGTRSTTTPPMGRTNPAQRYTGKKEKSTTAISAGGRTWQMKHIAPRNSKNTRVVVWLVKSEVYSACLRIVVIGWPAILDRYENHPCFNLS
jgi:hypothetical protein